MLARFSIADGAEVDETSADEESDPHGISEGDFNKLAALKARMQGEDGETEL